jgi:hypothetical protein
MARWSDIHVVHKGQRVVIDGVGFSGIGRLELLQLCRTAPRHSASIRTTRPGWKAPPILSPPT